MRTDALKLTCDKLQKASFVGFRGKEYISRPYELELFFTLPAGTSAKEAVGHKAKVDILKGDGTEPVTFHGVIAGVRLLHPMGERALYRALLVPRLWMLRHFRRSNVFTFKKIQDFLGETLEDGGLPASDFKFSIDPGAYPEEEFVAQYRESHLDFFHRWLEREGLFYYFEHKPDGDAEKLIIVDDIGLVDAFPGAGKVRYFPTTGNDVLAREALHHIETETSWLPKSITIEDYDYSNPSAPLKGESPVSKTGLGVIHDYGYRVFVDKDAKRLSEVKAQAINCRATTLRAEGDALGPRAGYKLKIDDRPEDVEEEWLAVEIAHQGVISGWTPEFAKLTGLTSADVYRLEIFAVPASVPYRSPQTTPWPRVNGFENGTVGGPADSQYAQLDADGRYLVRFQFDQSDLSGDKVSTRIRMLQPHGGDKEGFHFPLRKETEVMIAFLGGDPDRPFICGVVPNALKPSVVGERNHTQNVIRTGSNNQLVMEDQEGKEFIFMHTPNSATGIYMGHPAGPHSSVYTGEDEASVFSITDGPGLAAPAGQPKPPGALSSIETTASMHIHTEMNHVFFIGGSSTTFVGTGPENTYVGGDVVHGYKGTYGFMVGQAANEFYYATRNTTTFGAHSDTHKVGYTHTVEANGMIQNLTDKLHQTVNGSGWSKVVGGTWLHEVSGNARDHYGSWTSDIDGDATATIKGTWGTTVTGPWNGKFAKGSVTIDATPSNLSMHADAEIKIDAPKVDASSSGIWNSWLQVKNETFLQSGAYGVVSTALTGLKMETTGIAITNAGARNATFGGISEAYAAASAKAGATMKTIAADVWTGAFKKT